MGPGFSRVGLLDSRGLGGVELLVFDGCEHASALCRRRRSWKIFEVLEQGIGERDASLPTLTVDTMGRLGVAGRPHALRRGEHIGLGRDPFARVAVLVQ